MMQRVLTFLIAITLAASARAADPPQDPATLRNEAFQFAQQAMTGAAAQALAQLGVRFSAGDGELAGLVRQRQDLIASWKEADRRLVKATGAQAGFVNVDDLAAEVARLQRAIDASDIELRRRFPDYAELAQPRPLPIAAAQALLDDDEALIVLLVGKRESFSFALTRDGARVARVAVSQLDLIPQVKALRRSLNPSSPTVMRSATRGFDDAVVESGDTAVGEPFSRKLAWQIYRDFLAPHEATIADKRRVFFVLDRPLDSLPMSLLVTSPPDGNDADPAALRQTAWLLRRQGVVVLPSVASLKVLRSGRAQARAPEPFRGYGAPQLGDQRPVQVATRSAGTSASVLREGRVDPAALRMLAPLPKTEGELKRLAEALGSGPDAIRVGPAATVSAVKADDLKRFQVIAFATHGLLAGELSGLAEPALVFTPPVTPNDSDNGLLTASEAARLDLAADWVVLSACNTASGDGTPGADGLSGLARAFFYAGARSLLVSHWPVRDDAAARLTTETFRALRADPSRGKAEAFRSATLALMDDASDPTLAHPAIWAPFVIVGEGR